MGKHNMAVIIFIFIRFCTNHYSTTTTEYYSYYG